MPGEFQGKTTTCGGSVTSERLGWRKPLCYGRNFWVEAPHHPNLPDLTPCDFSDFDE